ncbi:DNA topoisomerase I [Thermaerobacter marianensis DSM 12885]|uniref:DNA topoisomerase I n=1 Tax=Thermaerobacter marianensis (strain ATCC 700841 / DSM 12885 / JCM 10246 / 7p75a) TaxID=644966 RepID=E6SIB4_THEM7|nr:AAA domain-containing protein [Thermaerobacter marianensis]ADU51925.1 DNA topoisomerase I [Thermaerobacter marianensis DSM 12885]
MFDFNKTTQLLIQAVAEEIEATKESGGAQGYRLLDGRRLSQIVGQYIYDFAIDGAEVDIPSDSPAQLKVGDDTHPATILSLVEGAIRIAVPGDLGPTVPAARLFVSPTYILEALRTRLEECLENPSRLSLPLIAEVFEPGDAGDGLGSLGMSGPSLGKGTSGPASVENGAEVHKGSPGVALNEEQQVAVHRAMDRPVTFIWGPPGTGKTRTLAALIQALMEREGRLLVTSHTNAAVDAVLTALLRTLPPQDREEGRIVRVGVPHSNDPVLHDVTLTAIVERKARPLKEEQAVPQASLNQIAAEIGRLEPMIRMLEARREAQGRVSKIKAEVQALSTRIVELRHHSESLQRNLHDLQDRLVQGERMHPLVRWWKGIDLQAIRHQIATTTANWEDTTSQLAEAERRRGEMATALDTVERELLQLEARLARATKTLSTPDEQVQERWKWLTNEKARMERRLQEIEAIIASIEDQVLAEAQIVGATLSKVVLTDKLYKDSYETIVIDEASMIPVPYIWFCAGLGRRRVVVAGDFRQLPPISHANDNGRYPLAYQWLRQDIFTTAGIIDENGTVRQGDPRLATLRKQYRMHPQIGELVNVLVYSRDGNPLQHHADITPLKAITGVAPGSGQALCIVDTSGLHPWCAKVNNGYSRYNLYDAVLAMAMVKEFLENGVDSIGVVAPYRAQVRLLQALRDELGLPAQRVQVATVHRFQGSERDVIIFDLTDARPAKMGKLLRGAYPGDATRLINVACSRARDKLIFLADLSYMESQGRSEDSLWEALRFVQKNGEVVDGAQFFDKSNLTVLAWLFRRVDRSKELASVNGSALYNHATFYDAFMADVFRARDRMVICSPFVHEHRLTNMMGCLLEALHRGVKVTIVSRHQDNESIVSMMNQMKDEGVQWVTVSKTHEKLAIIDNEIVWTGSLNILSHNGTSEIMFRIPSQAVAAQLYEFVGIERHLREQAARVERDTITRALAEALGLAHCPMCGNPMTLRIGRYGPFFRCADARCNGKQNIPRNRLRGVLERLHLPCPDCGEGYRDLRWRRQGTAFWGCSRFPTCRWTAAL